MVYSHHFQSYLSVKFWGKCVLIAMYLIHQLLSKVIKNNTPYELIFCNAPSYDHLTMFGCLNYAHNHTQMDKFDEQSKQCVFLGYPYNQKGYRLFDVHAKKFIMTRDITSVENQFPFQKQVVPYSTSFKILTFPNLILITDSTGETLESKPPILDTEHVAQPKTNSHP